MRGTRSTWKWKVLEKLGKGDEVVEVETSSEARRPNHDLPRTWTMRAIHSRRPALQELWAITLAAYDLVRFHANRRL